MLTDIIHFISFDANDMQKSVHSAVVRKVVCRQVEFYSFQIEFNLLLTEVTNGIY